MSKLCTATTFKKKPVALGNKTNGQESQIQFYETAVRIEVLIFWVVVPCSVAAGYQRFGGPCASIFRVGIQTPHYTAQQPRKAGLCVSRRVS
jgi:hypothetical protein